MFLAILTYQKPVDEVARWLVDHRAYLDENYKPGCLLASVHDVVEFNPVKASQAFLHAVDVAKALQS